MKISLVTDELSSDLETAFEIGTGWGIKNFELRGIGTERIGSHSEYTESHIKKMINMFDVHISAVSPGIFKINHHKKIFEGWTVLKWQDVYEFEQQEILRKTIENQVTEVIPRTIDFCKEVGCNNIIIFSFNKPGELPMGSPLPNYLYSYFEQVSSIANDNDINFYIENEHICYGDQVENVIDILKRLNNPHIAANWDPGNAYFAYENPYPDAYEKLKPFIKHVHMKDAITKENGEMEYVTSGEIDWEGQLTALKESEYNGYLSIETHCRPKISSAKKTLDRIIHIFGSDVLNNV